MSLFVLLVGGIGTIIAMLMGVMEIVGNQIIGIAVPGARELTESVMVLIVFGALAYAQLRRRHIRVELVYVRMGPETRAAMDVIADLAALLFFGLLLWQAYREVEFSLMFGEATDGLIRSCFGPPASFSPWNGDAYASAGPRSDHRYHACVHGARDREYGPVHAGYPIGQGVMIRTNTTRRLYRPTKDQPHA